MGEQPPPCQMTEVFTATVPDRAGRLDRFLAGATGLTRNRVQYLISAGVATVNGRPVSDTHMLIDPLTIRAGDHP